VKKRKRGKREKEKVEGDLPNIMVSRGNQALGNMKSGRRVNERKGHVSSIRIEPQRGK